MKSKIMCGVIFSVMALTTFATGIECSVQFSPSNGMSNLIYQDLQAASATQKDAFQFTSVPFTGSASFSNTASANIAVGYPESQAVTVSKISSFAVAASAVKGGSIGNTVVLENLYNLDNIILNIKENANIKNYIIVVPTSLYTLPDLKNEVIKIAQQNEVNITCVDLQSLNASENALSPGQCIVVLPTESLSAADKSTLLQFMSSHKDGLAVYSTQNELLSSANVVVDSGPIAQTIAGTIMMNLKNHFLYNLGITVTQVPFYDATISSSGTQNSTLASSYLNSSNYSGESYSGASVTLPALLSYMLSNNPAILSANQNVESTGYQVDSINGAYMPQLSANLQGVTINANQAEYAMGQARQFATTGNLQLSQVIYNGDLNFASKQAAVTYTMESLNRDQTINSIYTQTVQSYLNLLQAQANSKLVKNSLDVINTNLKLAQSAQAVGTGDMESVLRLQSQQMSYKNQYLNSQLSVKNARSSLVMLTGNSSMSGASLADISYNDLTNSLQAVVPSPQAINELKTKLYAYVLKNNLQLQLLQSQIQIAKYNEEYQNNQFVLPTVSAFGQLSQVISQSNPIYPNDMGAYTPMMNALISGKGNTNWSLGVQVSYPLFTGFTTTNSAKSAKSKVSSLTEQYNWGVAQVENQIDTSINQISMILYAKDNSASNVISSNKSLLLAQAQFQAGTSNITDFLSAQNADFQALTQDVNLKYSYFEAIAQLKSILNMASVSDSDFGKEFNIN
ncbi:MAG: TolC family protein [Fusobacteria bacterium]|nr:TolC family protein [Fusobacteriota bacterium]